MLGWYTHAHKIFRMSLFLRFCKITFFSMPAEVCLIYLHKKTLKTNKPWKIGTKILINNETRKKKTQIWRNCRKKSKSESQKLGNIGKFTGIFRGKEEKFFSLAETIHILVLSETETRDICSFKWNITQRKVTDIMHAYHKDVTETIIFPEKAQRKTKFLLTFEVKTSIQRSTNICFSKCEHTTPSVV